MLIFYGKVKKSRIEKKKKGKGSGWESDKREVGKRTGVGEGCEHKSLNCSGVFTHTTKHLRESGRTTSTAKLNLTSSCNISTLVSEQCLPMS